MPATVRIPTSLRNLAGGSREIEVPSGKLTEVFGDIADRYPELAARVVGEDGKPRRFVNVFVAENDIRFLDGIDTEVPDGEVITILPAVAGG